MKLEEGDLYICILADLMYFRCPIALSLEDGMEKSTFDTSVVLSAAKSIKAIIPHRSTTIPVIEGFKSLT